MSEILNSEAMCGATVNRGGAFIESAFASGHYHVIGRNRYGEIIFEDEIQNVVMTEGKNVMLDAALAGSAYTVVGPFLGLVTTTSFTAFAAGDTSSSHTGWIESTAYTAPRKTMAWSVAAAGSKALSAGLVYAITGTDTIQGVAAWYGTGAVSTVGSTAGKLLSGGSFSGGTKAVANGDSITVTYSFSI